MTATLPEAAAGAASTPPVSNEGAPGQESAPALEWTFNPWRQDVRRALVGVIATVASAGLIASAGLPLMAVAALVLVFLATVHAAILPTRCRVDDDGVGRWLAFGWERRSWEGIRSATLRARGLFVSPGSHGGALASFRGLWLPIPADAGPGLAAALQRRLAEHGLAP